MGAFGKFLPSLKLRLGTKAVISAVLLIGVNTALVVGAGYRSLTNEFGDRAFRDIEVNLRALTLAFGETFKDARITLKDGVVSKVEIPAMPEFRDHAIVDRAVGYVGGNATLFVYDDATNQFVRRTTNVKKENGDRAVGTQLAADHPGQAMLRRGEAYKGPATLFGKSFMTAYFPVSNPAGKVVGIIYVGIPMEQLDAMLAHAIQTMAVAAAVATLLVLILTMLIVRRVTKPLTSVTETLTAIADGRHDVEIDCADRGDEIGEIARTVAVFKSNAAERKRMREQQAADAAAAHHRRKAELKSFVDEFQTSIGGMIDKVMTLLRRSRTRRPSAHRDGARHRRSLGPVGRGIGKGLRACPCGRRGIRRAVQLDLGNQPPRPGVQRHCGGGREAGRRHRSTHHRALRGRRADRRRGQADHDDCRADQSLGAQRHHRGGARR